jgi:hypothetical protein
LKELKIIDFNQLTDNLQPFSGGSRGGVDNGRRSDILDSKGNKFGKLGTIENIF